MARNGIAPLRAIYFKYSSEGGDDEYQGSILLT